MKANFLKRLIILLFVLEILAASPAFADGIYVSEDLKHARGEHTVIALNEAQTKDVERTRRVVLTDEQLKPLKAIYEKTPNEFDVLSSRWELCTCGVEFYGIWCRPGELDVPHSNLKLHKHIAEQLAKGFPPEADFYDEEDEIGERAETEYAHVGKEIILDSKGDMYLEENRISEEKLRLAIDEIITTEVHAREVTRYLRFDTPPPINEEVDKRIHNLLSRTKAYCEKKDLRFGAMGFRLD